MNEVSYLSQEQFIPNYLSVKKAISLSIDRKSRIVFCQDKFVQSLLNKAIKNEGTIYYEKYIKGIQFQIEGAKNADAQKSLKGQQLYGEYAEYMEKDIR